MKTLINTPNPTSTYRRKTSIFADAKSLPVMLAHAELSTPNPNHDYNEARKLMMDTSAKVRARNKARAKLNTPEPEPEEDKLTLIDIIPITFGLISYIVFFALIPVIAVIGMAGKMLINTVDNSLDNSLQS